MGLRILWFRRDLRLTDHPALAEAARGGDEVLGLFVRDPQLIDRAGTIYNKNIIKINYYEKIILKYR